MDNKINTRITHRLPHNTLVVDSMPSNICAGDIIVASPIGEIRNHAHLNWYQKAWLKIEVKMRGWLGIK